MSLFCTYLATDRLHALASGQELPSRAHGAALLADVSGFTRLTEALVRALGTQRAAEELSSILDRLYLVLIEEVERYGGSVVGFSGDAITCWFADDQGEHALTAALAMQQRIQPLADDVSPGNQGGAIAIKVSVLSGTASRFLVGDSHFIEVLAGRLLEQLGRLQQAAQRGEVVTNGATYQTLHERIAAFTPRTLAADQEHLIVVEQLSAAVAPRPWPALRDASLPHDQLRRWLAPPVATRLEHSPAELFAELRPVVALMLVFDGIDYDGDDDAPAQLDRFVRWVQAVLAHYEGLLVDITMSELGSYLYCAFGAPLAHEDDATRAVSAAMQLHVPPAELASITNIRIGIAAGPAHVGAYGSPTRRAYGVLGRAPNTATRLMQHALPGAVLIDETTAQLAANHWHFTALPHLRIKGHATPIPVYQPSSQRTAATPRNVFVGRERELDALLAALEALHANRATTVLIEGEAGIGKSRVLREFVRVAQSQGLHVLQGAGQSAGAPLAYGAWRDILNDFFGLSQVLDTQQRYERVRDALAELRADLLERLPLLNPVLGLKAPDTQLTASLDASLRKESLIDLIAQLCLTQTRRKPLVIILEDAQWLDQNSWELVQRLTHFLRAAAMPLLLLIVIRTDDGNDQSFPHLSELFGLPDSLRLGLGRLEWPDVTALIAGRLRVGVGEVPPGLVALVDDRAAGNPLFVEELLTTLCEQQLVQVIPQAGSATQVRLHDDFQHAELTMPTTLQGLLLARIDRLSTETQATLKVAAVLGAAFALPALQHLHALYDPVNELPLRQQLAFLISMDFLEHRHNDPEQGYQFKHVLVREAAYQTLLFSQRRELHLAAANWYEQLADLPQLVHHYHHAGERERERQYAQLAGIQATDQFAHSAAVAFFSRALELTAASDYRRRVELLLARVKVYDLQGDRVAGDADLVQLEQLVQQIGDDALRLQVLLTRADYAINVADFPASIAAAAQVLTLASPDAKDAAHARASWGWSLFYCGEYNAAREQLEQALALAREWGWGEIEADALNGLGLAATFQGNFAEAKAFLLPALALSRSLAILGRESAVLTNLGTNAIYQGDLVAAQEFYTQDLALAQQIGDQYNEGISWHNLAMLASARGEFASAQSAFQQAMQLARASNNRALESQSSAGMGTITCTLLGDYAAARPLLERALHLANEVNSHHGVFYASCMLGLLAHYEGDHADALAHIQKAMALAEPMGHLPAYIQALSFYGLVLGQLRNWAEAQVAYRKTIALAQELGIGYMHIEAVAGLARVLLGCGELAEAYTLVEEVWQSIQQHGLDSTIEPAQIYFTCYQVLCIHNDPRAPLVLREAYAFVERRAGLLMNPEQRECFYTQIAAHREIVREFLRQGSTEHVLAQVGAQHLSAAPAAR